MKQSITFKQASQEAASSGATSFLGGQASVLGMSPRLVAKNLAASPSQQQQQQQQATGSGSSSHSTNKNGSAAGVRVVGEARSSSNDVGGVRSGGAYDGSGEGLCQVRSTYHPSLLFSHCSGHSVCFCCIVGSVLFHFTRHT